MVTLKKSKLLPTSSTIQENTYYYEFLVDEMSELPDPYYDDTIVAHGSKATVIENGRVYRMNSGGEWCIQHYNASDPILVSKTITENGTYNAESDEVDGYSVVIADVPNTYTESDEGKVVDSGELIAQTARAESITENGTYDTTTNNSVTVNVVSENNAKFVDVETHEFTIPTCLEAISIPIGTTTISLNAFSSTMIWATKHITIPSTVTTIDNNAFGVGRFSGLETITINKAEGSITGAPWGATNATVTWTG